jgi:hypothetical protein
MSVVGPGSFWEITKLIQFILRDQEYPQQQQQIYCAYLSQQTNMAKILPSC